MAGGRRHSEALLQHAYHRTPLGGASHNRLLQGVCGRHRTLMGMLDYGTQADILQGNLLAYKGAIFENLVADFLCKAGQPLYYFRKESGLELDFLLRYQGACVILEVKAKGGKAKSMRTVLKNKHVYHVHSGVKLGQYNVGRNGEALTLPLYMGFLLEDKIDEVIIPDVDLSAWQA